MKNILLFAVLAACAVPLPNLYAQGSLTPPGSPTPTMKTLDQVEPRTPLPGGTSTITIGTSGSYYLTGNLTVGSDAIVITNSDVTLDLNGFTISAAQGIVLPNTNANVRIRNGSIRGALTAIPATYTSGLQVEDMHFTGCQIGVIAGNAFRGERLRFLDHNGREGIAAGINSVVRSVQMNGGRSFTAIQVGDGAVVENCTVSDLIPTFSASFTRGIRVGAKSVVSHCTVSGCNVTNNSFNGILTDNSALITGCNISGNSSSNTLAGISVSYGSTVERCVVAQNVGDGISIHFACRTVDNNCAGNTGSGIFQRSVGGTDCRIDNNLLTGNGIGLRVLGSGHLIVRNTASGNATNYVIAASNQVGPIVSAPASVAINGSTGGSGVGSTDPWANISF